MDPRFFEQPILNSPYEYPFRHWELDVAGQPTNKILPERRKIAFITPIPKPKKSVELYHILHRPVIALDLPCVGDGK